jgi:hypothetical protein
MSGNFKQRQGIGVDCTVSAIDYQLRCMHRTIEALEFCFVTIKVTVVAHITMRYLSFAVQQRHLDYTTLQSTQSIINAAFVQQLLKSTHFLLHLHVPTAITAI